MNNELIGQGTERFMIHVFFCRLGRMTSQDQIGSLDFHIREYSPISETLGTYIYILGHS